MNSVNSLKVFWVMLFTISLAISACAQEKSPRNSENRRATSARVDSLAEATRQGLIFVKGGTFMMGDRGAKYIVAKTGAIDTLRGLQEHYFWTDYLDDQPAYEVRLSSYSIQEKEVDYRAYDLFTQVTGRESASPYLIGEKERGPRYPAGAPSWQEARDYCRWIGKQAGMEMDLPTEAQWEYAARSRGRNVAFATESDTLAIDDDDYTRGTHSMFFEVAEEGNVPYGNLKPVGSYPPNKLGLYDMTSNVREWTLDWYDENYYRRMKEQEGVEVDPQGPETGSKKTARGGSIADDALSDNNFSRHGMKPDGWDYYDLNGFRCVANQDESVE